MGRISVIIPTAARPETLEVTLRAVSGQVCRDLIDEVVVSENLGDRRSEETCRMFPELPIRYVLRDPQLSWNAHAQVAMREARSEFVAFCCDDDVWAPGHLATGVEALDRHPRAQSFFSQVASAESDLSQKASTWIAPLLWMAAGYPPRMSEYLLDRTAMLAVNWMYCPFRWSTLIGRTHAVGTAAEALTKDEVAPYWADCDFEHALAREGDVIFAPAIDMLYRQGPRYWETHGLDQRKMEHLFWTSRSDVLAEATSIGVDLPEFWRNALAGMPDEIAQQVGWWFRGRFSLKELEEYGFAAALPPDPRRTVFHHAGGRLARAMRVLRYGSAD